MSFFQAILILLSIHTLSHAQSSSEKTSTGKLGKQFATTSPWTNLLSKSFAKPQNRYCHVASVCNKLMVVHGGAGQTPAGGDIILSDTWAYNAETLKWTQVMTSSSMTTALQGPTRVYHTLSSLTTTPSSGSDSDSS